MRLLLLTAVVLLAIDALYYDGSYTQSAHRELSVAVTGLIATANRELDRTAEQEPETTIREEFRSGG